MGLPRPTDKVEDAPDKRFSSDILKIELSGPKHQHLTIVDVPGLFHSKYSSHGSFCDLFSVSITAND